jgi:DNA-binding CsgD family transcriptional regulator
MTKLEKKVLELRADGKTNREVGLMLNLSAKKISNSYQAIRNKANKLKLEQNRQIN